MQAAKQLGVEREAVEEGVQALCYVLLRAASHGTPAEQLLDGVELELQPDALAALHAFYEEAAPSLAQIQSRGPALPSYHSLEWRLQVQIAGRHAVAGEVQPSYLLRLHTEDARGFGAPQAEHLLQASARRPPAAVLRADGLHAPPAPGRHVPDTHARRRPTLPTCATSRASWTRRCARRPRSIRAAPRGASRASDSGMHNDSMRLRKRHIFTRHHLTETQRLSDARRGSDERRERVLALGLVAEDLARGAREAEEREAAVLVVGAVLRGDRVALADGGPDLTQG